MSVRCPICSSDSIIVLMGKTAMDKESYNRVIPRIWEDKTLFPDE